MERDEIKVVHMGQARLRYQAMMDGVVDACTLMEPYIAYADKTGCQLIIEGRYAGSEMSSPDLDAPTTQAIERAISKAVTAISADKRKYLHYLIDDLAADLPRLSVEDFHLPRLLYVRAAPVPHRRVSADLRVDAELGSRARRRDLRATRRQSHRRLAQAADENG